MEAEGKFDFDATSADELTFRKRDKLKILDKDDPNWFKAEMEGREGLVPANYLQVAPHPWFMGKLSRRNTEEKLSGKEDGVFLVRESESTPGDFSLSVVFNNAVQHFKVLRDGAGKYFLWVVKFNSLNELIEYHRTSSVSRTQHIILKDFQESTTESERIVVAMYDFEAEDEQELSFKKGELIILLDDKTDENWWKGKCQDKEGIFPKNYVKEKSETD